MNVFEFLNKNLMNFLKKFILVNVEADLRLGYIKKEAGRVVKEGQKWLS